MSAGLECLAKATYTNWRIWFVGLSPLSAQCSNFLAQLHTECWVQLYKRRSWINHFHLWCKNNEQRGCNRTQLWFTRMV